jgi:hypothetical protein
MLENHIVGMDWLPGTSVTVTVDDPSNGPGIDFTDIKTADSYGTALFYNLGSLLLEPGMHVTMAGGGTLKSHTVMDLKVSQVDIDTDTVSGTGNLVGANLNIQHCQVEGCLWRRWATVQADGTWKADFSTAGPGGDETEILDMVPGTPGVAMWPDEDADHTEVNWYPAKRFAAYPDEERVDGTGWPWGKTITMTINDPGTPANPDYSDTTIVAAHPGNITQEWFNIDFHTQYDLKAGDIVTVTDGTTVKVHTVTGLKITDANPNANAVSGTAEAGSYVDIATCGVEGCVFRTELADLDGNWSANFGLIGDQPWEQALSDILPNTNGSVNQWDADADSTNIGWLALCKLFLPLIRR